MTSQHRVKYWIVGVVALVFGLGTVLALFYGVPYYKERRWRELTVRAEELYRDRYDARRDSNITEAIRAAEEALQIAEDYFPYGHGGFVMTYRGGGSEAASIPPMLDYSLVLLAWMHWNEGHYADAEPLLRRRLELLEKKLPPEDATLAPIVYDLGKLYREWERFNEAEPLFRRSLALYGKLLATDHPHEDDAWELTKCLRDLLTILLRSDRYEEASAVFKPSAEILVRAFGSKHGCVQSAFNDYSDLLSRRGHHREAEAVQKRQVELWNHLHPPSQ